MPFWRSHGLDGAARGGLVEGIDKAMPSTEGHTPK